MNKTHVIEHLRFALEAQLTTAKVAAKTAHDTATHEENIAENKYDTLGLEAAYLAQGQAQRVNDCYKSIELFEPAFNEKPTDKIAVGSLICLEDDNAAQKWFYLGPAAGGLTVEVKGSTIQVVTPEAPLGKLLLDKHLDDEVSLTIMGKNHEYDVIELL
ncbi:GreA/GreB family elongation factor [Pseudoalteromonas sp. SWXJZ10B]|uniref:GreA/GreB family elongation factor n=1 Tax=Pseudoalteromonas sp. SWXJZ10B TaxID=2792063 RepID=UPI0018CD555B|nr:GreA/GreB family elongation factor [Pseudoalteromonas sp. SWXJZ10B]MBH0041331.1 GreA/GreB family elongation factor [Pseudoalteromonas sp. SWXJZ10B]